MNDEKEGNENFQILLLAIGLCRQAVADLSRFKQKHLIDQEINKKGFIKRLPGKGTVLLNISVQDLTTIRNTWSGRL